jgi:hypothetical protein
MSTAGVVTASLALCAFTANCTLLVVLRRAELRARRVIGHFEPIGPTPLADEIEGWLRELR